MINFLPYTGSDLIPVNLIFQNKKEISIFKNNFYTFLRAIGKFIANDVQGVVDCKNNKSLHWSPVDAIVIIGSMLTRKQRVKFVNSVQNICLFPKNGGVWALHNYSVFRGDIDCITNIISHGLRYYNNNILPNSLRIAKILREEGREYNVMANNSIKRR